MAYWFLELIMGLVLVSQVRLLLEFILRIVAPRRWRASTLPTLPDSQNHARVILLSAIGGFGLVLALSRLLSGLSAESFICSVIGLAIFVSYSLWMLVHLKHWWLLEPGSPLRERLDALGQRTSIPVGRVRLRASALIRPRVYMDGSIDLSTSFLRDVPLPEQEFLLAAALHQRKSRYTQIRIAIWLTGLCLYMAVMFAVIKLGNTFPLHVALFPLMLYGAWMVLWGAIYSKDSLRFALSVTGDLEAARKAILRVDAIDAAFRLAALEAWWQEQPQPATLGATSAVSTTSTPPTQQVLGRKP